MAAVKGVVDRNAVCGPFELFFCSARQPPALGRRLDCLRYICGERGMAAFRRERPLAARRRICGGLARENGFGRIEVRIAGRPSANVHFGFGARAMPSRKPASRHWAARRGADGRRLMLRVAI